MVSIALAVLNLIVVIWLCRLVFTTSRENTKLICENFALKRNNSGLKLIVRDLKAKQ